MVTSKNVLLVSPEPWSHIFVSKHQYAIHLSRKGYKVFFLNPPSLKKDVEIVTSGYENLFVVDYSIFLKGQRFLPLFVRRWVDRRMFRTIEKKANCRFNIIWNFENSRFYNFGFLPAAVLKIYHQVDLNQDFHLKEASKTADICFCTTDFIKRSIEPFNKNVFKIHHAFSGQFSARAKDVLDDRFVPAVPRKEVKVYYIGNLDGFYLDLDLIETLVRANSDVQFVFVGSHSKGKEFFGKFSNYPNVTIKGAIKADEINTLLDDADILLLAYDAENYREQLASPHKVMEYLASGKVIVATYTDEYKDKNDLLLMCQQRREMPALFDFALKNLQMLNDPAKMKNRIQFAMDNTYEARIRQIEKLIYTTLPNKWE